MARESGGRPAPAPCGETTGYRFLVLSVGRGGVMLSIAFLFFCPVNELARYGSVAYYRIQGKKKHGLMITVVVSEP